MDEFKDLCLIDKLLHCITKSLNWDAHPGSDDKQYRNFWTDDEIEFRNTHFDVINEMSVTIYQYNLKNNDRMFSKDTYATGQTRGRPIGS